MADGTCAERRSPRRGFPSREGIFPAAIPTSSVFKCQPSVCLELGHWALNYYNVKICGSCYYLALSLQVQYHLYLRSWSAPTYGFLADSLDALETPKHERRLPASY